jgi:hypothetical protein
MPKDEFDFEDPLELNGVAFLTEEDTSAEMAECFAEEFLRMGYNHKQVLALFRNPHYIGPNMVLANKGEPFVRDIIAETFARWGRPIQWPDASSSRREEALINAEIREPKTETEASLLTSAATNEMDDKLTDPLGNPAPKLNL